MHFIVPRLRGLPLMDRQKVSKKETIGLTPCNTATSPLAFILVGCEHFEVKSTYILVHKFYLCCSSNLGHD